MSQTNNLNSLDENTDHFLRDRWPLDTATINYNDMYTEEIGLGERLKHTSGDIIEVKAFRVLPTPRVWSGHKWYLLANCKRYKND